MMDLACLLTYTTRLVFQSHENSWARPGLVSFSVVDLESGFGSVASTGLLVEFLSLFSQSRADPACDFPVCAGQRLGSSSAQSFSRAWY
jgi:hypothetical protein